MVGRWMSQFPALLVGWDVEPPRGALMDLPLPPPLLSGYCGVDSWMGGEVSGAKCSAPCSLRLHRWPALSA
eukprot:13490440-Alexandrium_andersonii.AAC.1